MSNESYFHRRIGGRKGKMRLAHHIVWEEANGLIPENYEIHHIDHNKKNNDLENLKLVTVSDHQRIHSPYFGLLNGQWMRICSDCKTIGPVARNTICDPCRARRARIERRTKRSMEQE